jgi:hypothetical protein
MIINELSANADAYQFSTYYHKDRNGKLRAGPIWDQDLTFGYDLFFWGLDRSKTDTWQFWNGDNEGPSFWQNLFRNPEFKCYLSKRWNQLIQPGHPLDSVLIDKFIDKTDSLISEAVIRENDKWSTSLNHPAEIQKIKTFIQQRIPWITTNVGPCTACSNIEVPPLVITKIMYFPDSTLKYPESKKQEFIEITNTGNKAIDLTGFYFSGTGFVYQFPPGASVEPGGKKILASNSAVFISKYGIHPSGQYTRNLSNSGETLVLADAFGNVIDSVKYSNLPPWPDASANGYYLDLPDPLLDNSLAENWIASNTTIMGLEDIKAETVINLYPSPVTDVLQIESSGEIKSLQLISLQGYVIQNITVNSDMYILDMRSLSPGMYLVKVITADGNFVRKVVKD